MNIRSVTCFVEIGQSATRARTIHEAGRLAAQARDVLESAGFSVQTARLATQPLSLLPDEPLSAMLDLWGLCAKAGFDYLSLGPVLATTPDADLRRLEAIPELIRATDSVFAGVLVTGQHRELSLEGINRTARIVREIAHTTDLGFGNLRLAMLANVAPLAPFFPAAYHDGGSPALAIATESANLAVTSFSQTETLDQARTQLIAAIESAAKQIEGHIRPLAEALGTRFAGIDFSLAPYPEQTRSIAAAVERLGVERFGAPGTLFVASLLTSCLRHAAASYTHCGFNGLMLPVLEDAVLAARSREGMFTVNDLLLYSAVCGTGLDTVPLPGEIGEQEIAGILLDVAALALRLDKPLTARLMPVPGAKAGDTTSFDFSYFANGRVLSVKGCGCQQLFDRQAWLPAL
jgi:uncharacterized protein (UPF0210 family)